MPSTALDWLTATLLLTALLPLPYVLNRLAVRGWRGVLANPQATDAPLAPWAQRAQRAHANAVENLVVFAPAVLATQALGLADAFTAQAAAAYFAARLLHYLAYAGGIPGLRTVAYAIGWLATVAVLVGALRL
jgi:uncharacterized MAPEG superfamily protein